MGFVLVDDGHTYRCRIAAVAGLHGELLFSRRLMTPADVEDVQFRIDQALKQGKPRQASAAAAGMISEFCTEWDVVNKKGEPVPVSASVAAKLPPGVFNKLTLILQGARPTDPRNDWSAEEREEFYGGRDLSEEAARGN